MANAYRVPFKKKCDIDNNLGNSTTRSKKRKLSNDIPEEIEEPTTISNPTKEMPTKLRKIPRSFKEKTKKPINNEKGALKTYETSNERDKNIVDNLQIIKLHENNIEPSFTIQENITEERVELMKENLKLEVIPNVNEYPEANEKKLNIMNISTPCETAFKEKKISQSKKEINLMDLNVFSKNTTFDESNEKSFILNGNLEESISFKGINMDEPKEGGDKAIKMQIADLKIIRIVSEDSCNVLKENMPTEKVKNLDESLTTKNLQVGIGSNEEGGLYKCNSIQSQESAKNINFKGEQFNEESHLNIFTDKIIVKKEADDENEMNENCLNSKENKPTANVNLNTLDNLKKLETYIEIEKCTISSSNENKPDQIIKQMDTKVNLIDVESKIQLNAKNDTSASNYNIKQKSQKKVFNSKLLQKKSLTIPCMSALDYERECDKNNAGSSLIEKEVGHINDIPTTKTDLEGTENKGLISETFPTIKETKIEQFTEVLEFKELKMQNERENKVSINAQNLNISATSNLQNSTNLSSQLLLENKKLNLEDNFVNQELDKSLENSYNLNNILNGEAGLFSKEIKNTANINDLDKITHKNETENDILKEYDPTLESITFREEAETDDSVIPIGTFKHLNEIYEFNEETISVVVKDSISTLKQNISDENHHDDHEEICKNKSKTDWLIQESAFLVTASDCIKPQNCKISKQDDSYLQNIDYEYENEKHMQSEKALENNEEKEYSDSNNQEPSIDKESEIGTIREEMTETEKNPDNKPDFSDIENCLEMDDDFALTASQLKLLEADERMQFKSENIRTTTSQQTDICGYTYFGENAVTTEIINQLQYIRESFESIRKRLEKSESEENTPLHI